MPAYARPISICDCGNAFVRRIDQMRACDSCRMLDGLGLGRYVPKIGCTICGKRITRGPRASRLLYCDACRVEVRRTTWRESKHRARYA